MIAPGEEFIGVRFGEPGNAKDGASWLFVIKLPFVLPSQEHHLPRYPGI